MSGPFIITILTGHDSYFTRKIKNNYSTEQMFMAEDLLPLPPTLLPCDTIDGADVRYFNHSRSTIIHPFEKYLNIKSYHEKNWSPQLLAPSKFYYRIE